MVLSGKVYLADSYTRYSVEKSTRLIPAFGTQWKSLPGWSLHIYLSNCMSGKFPVTMRASTPSSTVFIWISAILRSGVWFRILKIQIQWRLEKPGTVINNINSYNKRRRQVQSLQKSVLLIRMPHLQEFKTSVKPMVRRVQQTHYQTAIVPSTHAITRSNINRNRRKLSICSAKHRHSTKHKDTQQNTKILSRTHRHSPVLCPIAIRWQLWNLYGFLQEEQIGWSTRKPDFTREVFRTVNASQRTGCPLHQRHECNTKSGPLIKAD